MSSGSGRRVPDSTPKKFRRDGPYLRPFLCCSRRTTIDGPVLDVVRRRVSSIRCPHPRPPPTKTHNGPHETTTPECRPSCARPTSRHGHSCPRGCHFLGNL